MKNRGFPKQLSTRMRRYFKHLYSNKSAVDEQGIINQLSTSLRVEVATFLVSTLMSSVDLFVNLGPSMWAQVSHFESRSGVHLNSRRPSQSDYPSHDAILTLTPVYPHTDRLFTYLSTCLPTRPKILPILRPCHYEEMELICTQHDPCNEMLVITSGTVSARYA